MGALLALIPTKDWIYGGVVVALLAGFGWYTVHERNIGKAHEVALVTKQAAIQAAFAKEQTDRGHDNALAAESLEVSITSSRPVADAPHLVVHQCTSAPVAAVRTAGSAEVSLPAGDSTVEHSTRVDIDTGPVVTIARDSDAQVAYLQSLLKSCIDVGACKLTP